MHGAWIGAVLLLGAVQQYSHGDPTPGEQLVLEKINRARANPNAEGKRLGSAGFPHSPLPGGDILEGLTFAEALPRPPLAFNAALIASARAHSRDMHDRDFFAHVNPDGLSHATRMRAAGYPAMFATGENIAVGFPSFHFPPDSLQDELMIDLNYPGRGHRINLLNLADAPVYREIGIGYYSDGTANAGGWEAFLTQNFGRTSAGPFLVGVVFDDAGEANDFYDPGEGRAGVTLTQDSTSSYAVTSASGGYACRVGMEGTVTVTPSGGGIPWGRRICKRARLTGENVKVDFKASEARDEDDDGMPDAWEAAHGISDPDLDADGDGVSNVEEFRFGTAPGPSKRSESAHGCGLVGPDLLWPLVLLRIRRRRRFNI